MRRPQDYILLILAILIVFGLLCWKTTTDRSTAVPQLEPQRQAGVHASTDESASSGGPRGMVTDLLSPSQRLCGVWRNVESGHQILFAMEDPELGIGYYRLCNDTHGDFGPRIRFKVAGESTDRRTVVLEVHNEHVRDLSKALGVDMTYSVLRCTVSLDGLALTKESYSTWSSHPSLSIYEYCGHDISN